MRTLFTNIKIALHEFDWDRYLCYIMNWSIGSLMTILAGGILFVVALFIYLILDGIGVVKYLPYVLAFVTLPPLAYYFAAKKWPKLR